MDPVLIEVPERIETERPDPAAARGRRRADGERGRARDARRAQALDALGAREDL